LKIELLDGAVASHRRFTNDTTFANILQKWESFAPSIQVIRPDGSADINATALTGARAEGYRLAMKNFIELSR